MSRILRHPRLSEEVHADIAARIRAGALALGARLPSEALLAEEFAVSRAVVREAVASLKAEGLVVTRQGAGSFVATQKRVLHFKDILAADSHRQQLLQTFELRSVIEGPVAALAAQRRSDADLAAMAACLERMDAAIAAGEDGAVHDDAFHEAIAAAAHNPYLLRLVEFVAAQFSESRRLTWLEDNRAVHLPQQAQREHRRLFEAIAGGDAAAARRRADEHLRRAFGRLGLAAADPKPARSRT
jgi:GntR family transcriptional repressor for pyruvate dehydrogenase complex